MSISRTSDPRLFLALLDQVIVTTSSAVEFGMLAKYLLSGAGTELMDGRKEKM